MQFYNQNPIRLIELFAGIGSQAKAMKNLGLDFKHWFVCEFDKYAIKSYNAIHNTDFTTSDVTKITAKDLNITDTEHFTYLLTYSFPCQDLSLAGKGKGMEKGSGTRSGLLWEVERLLNECTELPQILLMENVPQVHGTKNKEHFEKWIEFLASKGYSNHWQDLNAKDYEIPQSRNRCYMVSILGDYSYDFPRGIPLKITLKDVLEDVVDEKYYLTNKKLTTINNWNCLERPLEKVYGQNSIARTLTTRSGAECGSLATYSEQFEDTTNIVPLLENIKDDDIVKRVVCDQAIEQGPVSPYDIIDPSYANARLDELNQGTISTKNGENNQIANCITTAAPNFGVCVPRVVGGIGEKKSNGGRQRYQQDRIYDDRVALSVTTGFNPYYATREPRIIREEPLEREGWHEHAKEVLSTEGLCRTICAQSNNLVTKIKESQSLRIRKLTPKECWRLMGFDDEDFFKAEKVCSNSQLYKQAGNSIVVNVLMAIFKELFLPQKTRSQWLDDLLN